MSLNLAIYGYDSDIGKLVIEYLDRSSLEFGSITPLTPLDGEFDAVRVKGRNYLISSINDFDFTGTDILLMLCPPDETERLGDFLGKLDCAVIDASGHRFGDREVPVVIPKLNPYVVGAGDDARIFSIANSLATQIALALSPLHDEFGIKRANVNALVSVSELGMLGTEGLASESISLFNGNSPDNSPFAAQQAFNLINQIGIMIDDETEFEQTVTEQVGKVLEDFADKLSLYCIQVPIFYGHCIIVHVDLEESVKISDIKKCLGQCDYLKICDDKQDLVTPVTHLQNEDRLLVSRLKTESYSSSSVSFMVFMDNARVGQALSCIELIELMAKKLKKFA